MNNKIVQKTLLALAYGGWVVGVFISVPLVLDVVLRQIPDPRVLRWFSSPLGGLVAYIIENGIRLWLLVLPFLARKVAWKTILEKIGITRFRPQMIPWAFFAWGVYFILYFVVAAVLFALPTGIDWQQKQEIGIVANNNWGVFEYLEIFILLVIVAPIVEEIVFRGYLFGRLRTFMGFWVSALFASVLFGFLHGQWNVAVDVAILSLVMCYLRERFQSIWPGAMIHAIKNGLAYVILFILPLYGIHLIK